MSEHTAENAPSWDMGCGHFDSYGDPNHDCSTWTDQEPCSWCAGDLDDGEEHGENICGGWLSGPDG